MTDASRLFERVLTGQLRLDSEELFQLRLEAPETARELDELLALQGQLDSRGPAALSGAPTQADRDFVAATLKRIQADSGAEQPEAVKQAEGSTQAAHLFSWGLRLAAAALIATLVIVGGDLWDNGELDDIELGVTGKLEALAPVGSVPAIDEFRLQGDLSAADYYILRIWNLKAPSGSLPLHDLNLTELPWKPSAQLLENIPNDIRWQIIAFDRRGKELGRTEEVEASQQP